MVIMPILILINQKLEVVLAIFLLVTEASKKNILRLLERILYIHHPLCFWKNLNKTKALVNLGSEVNTMTSVYVAELNIGAQKIDGFILNTFEIVLADF